MWITWIALLCSALQIIQKAETDERVEIQCRWDNPEKLNFNCSDYPEAFFIEVIAKESGKSIIQFVLFPLQDIQITEATGPLSAIFFGVTEYAIVYEIPQKTPFNAEETHIYADYTRRFGSLIGADKNQNIINSGGNIIPSLDMPLISADEYATFFEVVCSSGSGTGIPAEKRLEINPSKMLRLFIVPDQGRTRELWLAPISAKQDSCIPQTNARIIEMVADAQKACLENATLEIRQQNYTDANLKISDLLSQLDCDGIPELDHYDKLLRKLLYIPDHPGPIDEFDLFPDYQPKLTPDIVTDFNPNVRDRIEKLPAADISNLDLLLDIFNEYGKAAKKNKGKWIDGNMILGAPAKEYRPSEAELLLSETGTRIVAIVEHTDAAILMDFVNQAKIKTKKIAFRQFTFYHADVMGSGRFFYVDQIVDVCLDLIKK